jgi:hypothetical protein
MAILEPPRTPLTPLYVRNKRWATDRKGETI